MMHPDASTNPDAHTVEEELLAELLAANQENMEALRAHDEMEQMALAEREEREVQERSRKETRLDRTVSR